MTDRPPNYVTWTIDLFPLSDIIETNTGRFNMSVSFYVQVVSVAKNISNPIQTQFRGIQIQTPFAHFTIFVKLNVTITF